MKNLVDRTILEGFLKRLPFLKSLSEQHAEHIIKDFAVIDIPKEGIVFYQSDSSNDLYIIIEGSVRASLVNDDGHELVLASFCKGDFFGEMSLFDGRPRSATLIASEDSRLGLLKREKFLQAISKEPTIATDILAAMVKRLRMSDEMIESLAFLDVGQRLIKLLLQIAETEGEKDRSGWHRIKKLTHKELAARTGSSREAVSKALKVLSFKNIIKENEGHLLIAPNVEIS